MFSCSQNCTWHFSMAFLKKSSKRRFFRWGSLSKASLMFAKNTLNHNHCIISFNSSSKFGKWPFIYHLHKRPQRRCCVLDAVYHFTCGWCNLLSTLKQYHHNSSSSYIAWQLLLITWILGRKTRSLRHIEPNKTHTENVTCVSYNCVVQKCSKQNNTEGPLKSEPLQFVPPRMSHVAS